MPFFSCRPHQVAQSRNRLYRRLKLLLRRVTVRTESCKSQGAVPIQYPLLTFMCIREVSLHTFSASFGLKIGFPFVALGMDFACLHQWHLSYFLHFCKWDFLLLWLINLLLDTKNISVISLLYSCRPIWIQMNLVDGWVDGFRAA